MKKMISMLLAMMLVATCALPAGAVDDEEAEDSPAPVTVNTAEELLEAIEAAEDGDTILIAGVCIPSRNPHFGSSEKQITLARADTFHNIMLSCSGSPTFENLIFEGGGIDVQCLTIFGDATFYGVTVQNTGESGIVIDRGNPTFDGCTFTNNTALKGGHLQIKSRGGATVTNSSFLGGSATMQGGGAILNEGTLHITDCTFAGNVATGDGGAICSPIGQCRVVNSTITGNSSSTAGGGIYCGGELTISDSVIYGNSAQLCGADISSRSKLEISISGDDLSAVYQAVDRTPLSFFTDAFNNRFSGDTNVTENEPLPISKESGALDLVFAFEDEIIAQEDEQQVEPAQEQEPEEPAQPSEQEAPKGQEKPEEPAPPQEQQEEPAQEPAPEPELEPEQPSAAVTPPSVVQPSYAPSRSSTRSSEGSDTSEPDAKQPEPEVAAPVLSCGGAALDTSGRAFLAGYGDGVIGEDDPVTRAQIAQIIYRLLTDESREALQTTENSFEDVPAEAWYNLAVSTIARAGIVIGCGDGFHPEGYITRAQLITIMARFVAPVDQGSSYADVTGHWAESFIGTAEAAGWLTGGGDLHPNEYASRREVVEFINHVFDLCEGAA